MSGTGFTSWLVRRHVKGTQRGRDGSPSSAGRLLYLQSNGEVVDLGAFTKRDLLALAWSWRVAYRLAREREERSKLARTRDAAVRLSQSAGRLTEGEAVDPGMGDDLD